VQNLKTIFSQIVISKLATNINYLHLNFLLEEFSILSYHQIVVLYLLFLFIRMYFEASNKKYDDISRKQSLSCVCFSLLFDFQVFAE
tara:strand:- start:854 stop:1114 length:261 start_codon:yes stop_codon:yes gene_type:complete